MVRHPYGGLCGALPHDHPEPPLLALDYLSGVLYPLPRRTESVHDGYRVGALPRRVLPDPFCLPRFRVGSASTLQLSGPAQALLALRPAKLLAHLSVDFVARFQPGQFPNRTARPAIESNHQVFEWVLPPLVTCPVRAHTEVPRGLKPAPHFGPTGERARASSACRAASRHSSSDQPLPHPSR